MPLFNVLSLIEYDESKRDINLIIIFDENDDKYYIYGSRKNPYDTHPINCKYPDFKICFKYDSLEIMLNWISCLFNNFDGGTKVTYELHQIKMNESEYQDNKLNYSYLAGNKLSRYTEIVAYEMRAMTQSSLMEKLDMLTGSTNL